MLWIKYFGPMKTLPLRQLTVGAFRRKPGPEINSAPCKDNVKVWRSSGRSRAREKLGTQVESNTCEESTTSH